MKPVRRMAMVRDAQKRRAEDRETFQRDMRERDFQEVQADTGRLAVTGIQEPLSPERLYYSNMSIEAYATQSVLDKMGHSAAPFMLNAYLAKSRLDRTTDRVITSKGESADEGFMRNIGKKLRGR